VLVADAILEQKLRIGERSWGRITIRSTVLVRNDDRPIPSVKICNHLAPGSRWISSGSGTNVFHVTQMNRFVVIIPEALEIAARVEPLSHVYGAELDFGRRDHA